jgi:hypothetical protein
MNQPISTRRADTWRRCRRLRPGRSLQPDLHVERQRLLRQLALPRSSVSDDRLQHMGRDDAASAAYIRVSVFVLMNHVPSPERLYCGKS